jgi:ABC-type glycerol-3-phosphate transport system substrate-binding protein
LGFEQAPQTPDQFQQQACAASRANRQDNSPDNDGTGGWIVSTQYAGMGGWLSAFGARVSEPGSSQYHFDTQPVQKAFTFLRGLYDQGCAWLAEGEPPEGEFASRLGLFSTGSMLGIPYQKQAFQQANNPDQWTVIPFPSPSGKAAIEVYGSYYVALPSTPEKQLAAWLLLKWLEAPENQAALIQAGGGFPASASAAQALKSYGTAHPQWAAALDLLPQANPEPARPSWATVRWALSDASTQLFRSYFTVQQVPDLTKLLDKTAADLESEK